MEMTDSRLSGHEILDNAEFFSHGYMPLAAAYCRRLGLVELVNRIVPSQMSVSPGLVVQAMVLDSLSGRTPLYRLEEFLAELDIELLLGEQVSAHAFNDTNLARSLDAVFEAGSSKILTELGIRATATFALDASVVSYDTTSTSVWGDYRDCEKENPPPGPLITYGHSKDHRPDLKQFMTELLCVERGVPIFGRVLNGNSSDKTSNNRILTRISSIMAKHGLGEGAFIYVADSAMVTKNNLEIIGETTRFVSRLPAVYSVCGDTIADVVQDGQWTDIGRLSENPGGKRRPGASYRACERMIELHGKNYRAVVIHSDAYDKRKRKKLNKALNDSERKLNAELKKVPSVYYCEADAREAEKKVKALPGKLHQVKTSVCPIQVRRRGRPKKDGTFSTETRFELQLEVEENVAAIEREKLLLGCFVLISNVPTEGEESLDAAGLLKVYKGQYGVESDFAFLKDPLVANDIFLKKPHRIDVIGMVLVIALLIWRLMERSMRTWVSNTGNSLPGWENRRTEKPTAFMLDKSMYGIKVMMTWDRIRIILKTPTEKQKEYLIALGLDESVFIDRHCKCKPIIAQKTK